MNGLKLKVSASFGVIAIALLCSVPAWAQGSFFSSLSGTVVDSAGLVIPGASVKVKNNGTGAEVDLVTGSDGGFLVPSIPGGNYSVIVELAGFRIDHAQLGHRQRGAAGVRESGDAGRHPV